MASFGTSTTMTRRSDPISTVNEKNGQQATSRSGKSDDGADFGVGGNTEFKSIRRDTLRAVHNRAQHLLPFAELRPSVARTESAGDRYPHTGECRTEHDVSAQTERREHGGRCR